MLSDASKSDEVLVANRVLAFLVQKTQGPASHYKRNFQVHVVERCTAVLKRGFEPEPSNITRRLTMSLTPMLVNLESSRTTGLLPRNPSVVNFWFTDSSLILLCSRTSYVLVAVFSPLQWFYQLIGTYSPDLASPCGIIAESNKGECENERGR